MSADHLRINVIRTGGVTGMRVQRTVDLDAVDVDEAAAWRRLLAADAVRQPSVPERPVPDGYVYRLACEAVDLDVAVPEQQLPAEHRALLARAVRPG
ncbi:hypothetical protein BH20ACT6_BH20ACT6_13900 [soil metagenome]